MSLEQALSELLNQNFAKSDPEETYFYCNALYLLCEERATKLDTLSVVFSVPEAFYQWIASLKSVGGILPQTNHSPMLHQHQFAQSSIDYLSKIDMSEQKPEVIAYHRGLISWLDASLQSQSDLFLWIRDSKTPFIVPDSRI